MFAHWLTFTPIVNSLQDGLFHHLSVHFIVFLILIWGKEIHQWVNIHRYKHIYIYAHFFIRLALGRLTNAGLQRCQFEKYAFLSTRVIMLLENHPNLLWTASSVRWGCDRLLKRLTYPSNHKQELLLRDGTRTLTGYAQTSDFLVCAFTFAGSIGSCQLLHNKCCRLG